MSHDTSGLASSHTAPIVKLLKAINVGPGLFLFPLGLSFLSAFFEGASVGLLVPLLRGLVEGDFGFISNTQIGAWVFSTFPALFAHSSFQTFTILLSWTLVATVLRIFLGYWSDVIYASQIRMIGHKARSHLFARAAGFGKQYYDTQKHGTLHNVILGFTAQITSRFQRAHSQIRWLFMLLAYLVLMLLISWKLTLIIVALFPAYYFAISRLIKKIGTVSRRYADADSAISHVFYDVISCIASVKAFGQEEYEKERFRRSSEQGAKLGYAIDRTLLLLYPVQETITLLLAMGLICAIAFIVMSDPREDIASYLIYFYLLKRSSTAISVVGDFRGLFASLHGPFSEIAGLLDDQDKHIVPDGSVPFSGLRDQIEIKHLSFEYLPDKPVLDDLSLSIEQGTLVALVGPSGSGKTTITQLLLRFYDVSPQTITIDGRDIRDFQINSLRRKIAYVSQDTELFHQTLRDNITYGAFSDISTTELEEVLCHARLDELVASLPAGLDTLVGDRGVQLSGGEAQRVSIARAILRNPEILILDEATSSLDATTEKLIQSALDQLVTGKTVIVVAHRFSTIKHADKIITLENGRVLESGTLEELLQKDGTFARLWKAQELFY